ncbi:response regulator [Fodinicola feengrottensis]|uniref:response regulator n=1 Tax=Fodinicola feengrottensis TaxID=435914 RepID=UPI0036F35327
MTTRVVLVDDQELVRTGFRLILANTEDLEVVGEAADGIEAISTVARTAPDIVLMDIRMPGLDGVETTRRILARPEPPKVIILTTFDLDRYVYAGLRAGASGFLLKDTMASELIHAVRVIAAGEAVIAPTTTRRLLERFVDAMPASDPASRRRGGSPHQP